MIGFPIWTFAVIAGALWADKAWGRYWGWDPKEVWAFITWIAYAAYLHARATAGWRGRAAMIVQLVAFGCLLFNLVGVNIFLGGPALLRRGAAGLAHHGRHACRPVPARACRSPQSSSLRRRSRSEEVGVVVGALRGLGPLAAAGHRGERRGALGSGCGRPSSSQNRPPTGDQQHHDEHPEELWEVPDSSSGVVMTSNKQ